VIGRHDLLIGGACLAAAGAAYGLKPRRTVTLLGKGRLADLVPLRFGAWAGRDVRDLVAPKEENSLAAKLYSQTVERVYRNDATGDEVMMLLAYGSRETDELQLHRPEVCYPAFGFALSHNSATRLALASGVSLPIRRLVADAPERRESIAYWSRLGDSLPSSGGEQRMDRFKAALKGYVTDGLLARFSVAGDDPDHDLAIAESAIVQLLKAVSPSSLPVLIGSPLAHAFSSVWSRS